LSASRADSWYHEKESAWLYRQVAAAEPDPHKRDLFLKLAAAAEEQAEKWQPSAAGGVLDAPSVRTFTPSLRARVVARLLRRFEARSLRMVLAAMKVRGLSIYDAAPVTAGHPMPTTLAQIGARHRNAVGGSLRAAVFGVNDGLVSNVSLVLGVAGAGVSSTVVLTTGAAGLLAGALSMAAGEYVSVRSQREMYEYQIALEREELAEYPQEEAEELALIYHARGVELEQARALSRSLLANPAQALEVLAREELGLNPADLGSPWRAAGASFVTFAVGAAVPLIPLLLGVTRLHAVVASAVITLLTLFAVGLGLSLFTGRGALHSALRMVLIGGGAGAVSFLVGKALGVATG
jgi:VIT1/CCC1 family predicted Fe2+/Mn2+ transporter